MRGDEFINNIKTQLGFNADNIYEGTFNFVKILFTGHRGSGKSTELKRIRKELETVYLVVPINIEKDIVKISALESEDLYQLFTLNLVEELTQKGISFNFKPFEEIANIWLQDTSFTKEYKDKSNIEIGGEAEAKISIWIATLKSFIKSSISSESSETKQVREKIKINITDIINRLNVALSELRYAIKEYNFHDILFIVDGTEKIYYELSKKIFIHDAALLNQINAHFIFSSPVYGLYDINKGFEFFTPLTLPMIKITEESIPVLSQIVAARIDSELFFDGHVLEQIVRKSGGCVRQMLQIVYSALLTSRGKKITEALLSITLYEMGRRLFDQLNSEHRKVLKEGYDNNNNFIRGDTAVKEMLFNLSLLACNGSTVINPIIEPFIATGGQ